MIASDCFTFGNTDHETLTLVMFTFPKNLEAEVEVCRRLRHS